MKYVILAILALFMCTQIGWSYQPSQHNKVGSHNGNRDKQ